MIQVVRPAMIQAVLVTTQVALALRPIVVEAVVVTNMAIFGSTWGEDRTDNEAWHLYCNGQEPNTAHEGKYAVSCPCGVDILMSKIQIHDFASGMCGSFYCFNCRNNLLPIIHEVEEKLSK